MFLKEIELTNLKCHENLYLSFENLSNNSPIRKTTFLLGENGTGKSALLKAIALVTAGSNTLGNLLGVPDEWIKNGKQFCEIKATVLVADKSERAINLRFERGDRLSEIIENNKAVFKIIEENKDNLISLDHAVNYSDKNYLVLAYGASRKLNFEAQFFGNNRESIPRRTLNIQSLFNPDSALVSLASWAMDLDYTGKGDGLKTVKRALNAFLLDNVKFKTIDKKKKQLIFLTPDGDIPLEQMSDGYQNVTAWVGDLMYRISETDSTIKDPLKAKGLLLIDEIDLHLHPKWQRQLHAFLLNKLPNFQVIATTHSPLTAQQADEGELYALRREQKRVELIPFKGAPNKMLLHQILMSPVFGLETDESLKVEKAKTKIREISLKGRKSDADKALINRFSETLDETPLNLRTNSLLGEEDLELLQTINRELKAKK